MEHLNGLNNSQKEAALHTEGPLLIVAGAGAGKTKTITHRILNLMKNGISGDKILAVTFTNKAAAELKERVRVKLLEEGLSAEADELGRAMIGTVHAVGVQLLKRFAFEAGVSPNVDIIAEEDQKMIFNQSISTILSNEKTAIMENLSEVLGFRKSPFGVVPPETSNDALPLVEMAFSRSLLIC